MKNLLLLNVRNDKIIEVENVQKTKNKTYASIQIQGGGRMLHDQGIQLGSSKSKQFGMDWIETKKVSHANV